MLSLQLAEKFGRFFLSYRSFLSWSLFLLLVKRSLLPFSTVFIRCIYATEQDISNEPMRKESMSVHGIKSISFTTFISKIKKPCHHEELNRNRVLYKTCSPSFPFPLSSP